MKFDNYTKHLRFFFSIFNCRRIQPYSNAHGRNAVSFTKRSKKSKSMFVKHILGTYHFYIPYFSVCSFRSFHTHMNRSRTKFHFRVLNLFNQSYLPSCLCKVYVHLQSFNAWTTFMKIKMRLFMSFHLK